MKLSEHADLELEILKQRLNSYKFVNGILAAVIIVVPLYWAYQVVKAFV